MPSDPKTDAKVRSQPQPGVLAGRWRSVCGGVVWGLVLLYFVEQRPQLTFTLPFLLVIASIMVTALHEGGHAIGAAIAGFDLLMFAVWPLKLVRRDRTWQLRWIGKTRLMGFVGVTPVGAHNLKRRLFIMVAAGPCASLLTGIAAAVGASMSRLNSPHWLVTELNCVALWSLLTVTLVVLPVSTKYYVNDGQRLRMLLRGGVESERFGWLLLLGGESYSGRRPRELSPELIGLLPGPLNGSADLLSAQLFRYNWLLDTGHKEEAGAVLTSALDQDLRPEVREILQIEMAWFEASFRGNLAESRRLLEMTPIRSTRDEVYRCTLFKARAATAFLAQRWDDAEAYAREALRHCDRILDAGTAKAIRESIVGLIDSIGVAKVKQQCVVP